MIEIPEPPTNRACASCSSPLVWLYSPRKAAWVAFVPQPTNPRVLEAHGCAEASPMRSWRDNPPPWEDPTLADRLRRGRELANASLARARAAGQKLTEEVHIS